MKSKVFEFLNRRHLYLLLFVYFLLRLVNLTKFPIFNDEAIYIDWANKIMHRVVSPYYSLYDGTPPLLLWVMSIIMRLVSSPLLAGRLVSVAAGAFSLLGVYKLALKFGDRKLAFLSSFIYTITPLFVFYDRQALMESSLVSLGVWTFYTLINFLETFKLRFAVISGVLLGFGFFIKPSFVIYLFPLSVILLVAYFKSKKGRSELYFGALAGFVGLFLTVLPLLSQKNAGLIFSKNDRYGFTFEELLSLPVEEWIRNYFNLMQVAWWHLTPTIFTLAVFGAVYLLRRLRMKNNRSNLYILLWLLLPLFASALLAKNLLTRYSVPFMPYISLIAALGIININKKLKKVAYFLLLIPLIISPHLAIDTKGYLEKLDVVTKTSDANVYLAGFTSGYGVREAMQFIESKAKNEPIIVGMRVDAGNPESAIFGYYYGERYKNIRPVYLDARFIKLPLDKDFIGYNLPFYFVSRDDNLAGMNEYLQEVERFYKPLGKSFIGVYKFVGRQQH